MGQVILAVVVGYLVGSAPTANGIARIVGIDLRTAGSGNPGANNARQLGGYPLAAAVLLVEAAKGGLAVWLGATLSTQLGAVLAGLAAVAGNVYNPWYRFKGGKGLAITLGVLLSLWPGVTVPLIVVMVATVLLTRSSGAAVITAIGVILISSALWVPLGLPTPWGVDESDLFFLIAVGLGLVLTQKHLVDALRSRDRPEPPAPA